MEQVAPYQFERTESPEAVERRRRRKALAEQLRQAESEMRAAAYADLGGSAVQLAFLLEEQWENHL